MAPDGYTARGGDGRITARVAAIGRSCAAAAGVRRYSTTGCESKQRQYSCLAHCFESKLHPQEQSPPLTGRDRAKE
jgi:hypothetical protein